MLHIRQSFLQTAKRACALLLCTCLLLNLFPLITPSAHAAEEDYYLNRLVSWDIMRGDQDGNLEPERSITRAEFVTLLNRTFGYTKTGAQPFKDVELKDWYYDDISAAYTAGYFQGTDKNAASPEATLTREEAATMLCRNLMLQPLSGEDLSFSDSHQASSWSRGYIKAAAEEGILRGDPDGRFRPLDNITRGEVAIMLVRVIGTPIQDPGTYSTSVSGNLMVSCSGVTLENMTVTGDLYITGGVGLGYVTLSNVTVYGKIIASGAGESNKGDCSIILKNCTAPEMIVDSPSNQYVTVRTVGDTDIDKVYVRTDTYLEGKSTGRHGFQYIEIDGEEGTRLDLAGNIHEVVAMTPESEINVGSGTVEKMTIDEHATDSTVSIAQGAVVEELNLDTATTVTGKGDIGTLNVNAPGCKVEMLPDDINIRPGITADINGTTMDSTLADQMSDSPRILSSYPRMDDIAPTQAEAAFKTNKPGTIYWAVRLSGEGEMTAGDLIKPPTYGANIVKNGNLAVKDANEVLSQAVSGLEIDTSYILSAVLVDSRGDQSPVKSVYFTTPDDSKPDFASGYPKASTIEDTYVDFDVATTKTCTLYWAVYKKGMTAPTINEFKDGSLSGAIDFGTRKMVRSEEDSIRMGNVIETAKNALAELTDYDAYFFLTDTVNNSAIKKISFTTADRTPPEFLANYPRISKIDKTALTGEAAINEDGKIYWAIVKHGVEYPVENAALSDDEARELDYKLQIMNGLYSLKNGSFSAKENTASSFNMSGLDAETAYDIYFVAEDDSGNLSEIKVLENAKTLDQNAPTLVELRFSQSNDEGIPLADTDITLVFSEDIYSTQTKMSLVEMYESEDAEYDVAGSKDGSTVTWAAVIRSMFTLNNLDIKEPEKSVKLVLGDETSGGTGKENMTVTLNEEGQTEVTFDKDALPLMSGTKYQFVFNFITDSSNNNMPQNSKSEEFRILDAQVDFNELSIVTINDGSSDISVDATFSMIPYADSTANASRDTCYDLIIASDTTISFDLYRRDAGTTGNWTKVTTTPISITNTIADNQWSGFSYNKYIASVDPSDYPPLQNLKQGYEYAIKLQSISGNSDPNKWDATIRLYLFCVAGSAKNLSNLADFYLTDSVWKTEVIDGASEVSAIGNPSNFSIRIVRSNLSAPCFEQSYPLVSPGDSLTTVSYQLDREGDVYYVVAPVTDLSPQKDDGSPVTDIIDIGTLDSTEAATKLPSGERNMGIANPSKERIMNTGWIDPSKGYRFGKVSYSGTGTAYIDIENLKPNSDYYIYFVLRGSFKDPSPVMCYQFSTTDVVPPKLEAHAENTNNAYYNVASGTDGTITAETYWVLYGALKGGHPEDFDKPVNGISGKTVLQAMVDESIDDLADSDLKESLWQTIRGQGSGFDLAQAGSEVVQNVGPDYQRVDADINSELLRPNDTYIFVVAAKNTQGGLPVFRALENIRQVNNEGPLIKNISTTPQNVDASTKATFSGSVSITFDQAVYIYKQGANDQDDPILYSGAGIAMEKDAQVITGSGYCRLPTVTSMALTIQCTNIPAGGQIQIVPSNAEVINGNQYFVSQNGYSALIPVQLRLEITENGFYQFVIDDRGAIWDGQTSQIDIQEN